MKKGFLQKQKERLEESKKMLLKELSRFAQEDTKIEGNWKSKFPEFDGSEIGDSRLEVAQDEVEEYLNRLPIEHSLEIKLQNINLSLKKINQGAYGKCEKCHKKISQERLEVCPEARFCVSCQPRS